MVEQLSYRLMGWESKISHHFQVSSDQLRPWSFAVLLGGDEQLHSSSESSWRNSQKVD